MRTKCSVFVFALALILAGSSSGAVAPNGIVVLLTDFGSDSIYVGALKGAMYSKYPEVRVDSLTNAVPAFDVVAGAYMLAEVCAEFPPGTTFCCVVDPGVGTPRKRIAVETKSGHRFVAPDNGLLTLAAEQLGVAEIRELTNKGLWRQGEESHTFHGRDVFGPVAAAVACGVPMAEVGPKLDTLLKLDLPVARVEDNAVHGEVVRSDVYGNLVTNIRPGHMAQIGVKLGDRIEVTVGGAEFTAPMKSAYGEVPEGSRLVVVQSTGAIECATNMRRLADEIAEGPGAAVTMRKAE